MNIEEVLREIPSFKLDKKLSLWIEDKTQPEDKEVVWVDSEGNGMGDESGECFVHKRLVLHILCVDGDKFYNKAGKEVFVKELNFGHPLKLASTPEDFSEVYKRELEKDAPGNEIHYRESFIKYLSEIIECYDDLFIGNEHKQNIDIKSRYIDFKTWLESLSGSSVNDKTTDVADSQVNELPNRGLSLDDVFFNEAARKKYDECMEIAELTVNGKPVTLSVRKAGKLGGVLDVLNNQKRIFRKRFTKKELLEIFNPVFDTKFKDYKTSGTDYKISYEKTDKFLKR